MTQALRIVVVAPDLSVADQEDAYAVSQAERSRSLRIGLLENGFNLVAVLPADTFCRSASPSCSRTGSVWMRRAKRATRWSTW